MYVCMYVCRLRTFMYLLGLGPVSWLTDLLFYINQTVSKFDNRLTCQSLQSALKLRLL